QIANNSSPCSIALIVLGIRLRVRCGIRTWRWLAFGRAVANTGWADFTIIDARITKQDCQSKVDQPFMDLTARGAPSDGTAGIRQMRVAAQFAGRAGGSTSSTYLSPEGKRPT